MSAVVCFMFVFMCTIIYNVVFVCFNVCSVVVECSIFCLSRSWMLCLRVDWMYALLWFLFDS